MHPSIRGAYPNYISITNRTINTNFKEGKIYLQYNALPSDEDGEIGIPTFSNGAIERYIENHVRIHLSQHLIINGKANSSLNQLLGAWMGQERQLFIEAKSESSWNGVDLERFSRQLYKTNRRNQALYNLPK